jgi:hypothetical protein
LINDSEKAKPLTWMIAIARNYAIDFYRKKQLPIIDDFDLNVIDDGQIQLLEKLEQSNTMKVFIIEWLCKIIGKVFVHKFIIRIFYRIVATIY